MITGWGAKVAGWATFAVLGASALAKSPARPHRPKFIELPAEPSGPVISGRVTITAPVVQGTVAAGNSGDGNVVHDPLPFLVQNFHCSDANLHWLYDHLPGADLGGHATGEYLYEGVQAPQFDVARALKLLLHDDSAQVVASTSVEDKYNLFKKGQREPLESVIRQMRGAYLASWGALGMPDVVDNVQFTTGQKELTTRTGRIRLLVHQLVSRDVITADLGGKSWNPYQSVIPVLIPAYDIKGFEVPRVPDSFYPITVTKITALYNPCESLGVHIALHRSWEAEIRLCPVKGRCPTSDAAALAAIERELNVTGIESWRVRGRKLYIKSVGATSLPLQPESYSQ